MYISSRDTIAEAFQAFKSFPKIKQIILYNLIPMVIFIIAGFFAAFSENNIMLGLALIFGLVGIVLIVCFYYFTYIKIMQYYKSGYVFKNIDDFMSPEQSIFRLIWKSSIIPILVLIVFFGVISGLSFMLTIMSGIIGTIIATVLVIGFLGWAVPKFVTVIPYLIENRQKGFLDSFSFSKGNYWYLTRLLFWVSLIYIALEIINFILSLLGSVFGTGLLGGIWAFLLFLFYIPAMTALYTFMMFIYGKAYFKIVGASPNSK